MSANPDDWARLEGLFRQAADLPSGERPAFLGDVCAGDPAMRRELESLLAADADSDGFLSASVSRAAEVLLEDEDISGSRVGPYRVIREIGRGGMGSVFLAVRDDDEYRKEVAIKLIRHGMDTADVLRRFRHERQILASLEHPYIARLLDGGTSGDGRPFFVMEYVSGKTLDAWCGERAIDIRERCELFLKICEAVSHAHRNLVVHRDLKPGNIFVTGDGSPKLLDFGVAKLLDPNESPANTATAMASRAMTFDYASPEQVRGGTMSTATDIYSLGAIFYELICGVRAQRFTGYGAREVERIICEVDPPRLKNADLAAIASMAMRKEPDRRYPSVEGFATDVRAFLNGWPVWARHGNVGYRVHKYLRRNRTPLAVAAALAIALVGGAAIAAEKAIEASQERQGAVESRLLAEASRRDAESEAREARTQRTLAQQQSQIAEAQRILSERRFDEVHQLSGKFLLDFHDAISKLPGSTPARKMVIETGLRYYDLLVRDAAGNAELLKEIATGYERLGDVQGNPYFGNLGDVPGAAASYRKAQEIRATLSDPSPAFLHDRIQGQVRLAQISIAQGDFNASERYLREGLKFPLTGGPLLNTYEVRDALAGVWSTLGDTRIREGRMGEAVEPYQHLLELSTGLARDTKDESVAQRRISLANTKLGDAYTRAQRPPEALPYMRTALAIDRKLAAAEPNNSNLTRKLFVDYNLLGEILRDGPGRSLASDEEISGYMKGAVEVSDKLAAADPDNRQYLLDITTASVGYGDWLRTQKKIPEAILIYRKGVAAAERLNRASAQTVGIEGTLMEVWQRLGGALGDAGQYEEGLADLAKAEEFVTQIERRNPGITMNTLRRSLVQYTRAQIYAGQKRWGDAIESVQASIAIYEDLAQRDRGNEEPVNSLPGYYALLADAYAGAGKHDAAVSAIQNAIGRIRAIESQRRLVPTEVEARNGYVAKLATWQSTPSRE